MYGVKQCFKCGEFKELSAFYKHPKMKDGHVNKCKECNKKNVRDNRVSKIDYYRNYDKTRGNRQTEEYRKEYISKNPAKRAAHIMVGNAIRDGKLQKYPCEVCGSTIHIHAHHDDYSKPLEVRWLCSVHHYEWHKENGEGKNGSSEAHI